MDWTAFQRTEERVFVAVEDRQVLGYSRWNRHDGHPCIRQLFVKRDARRRGAGTRLIQIGAKKVADFYFAESPNEASLPLLSKLGHLEVRENQIQSGKARVFWSA